MFYRPDNWVMFYAMTKVALPELPRLDMAENAVRETPRPFAEVRRKIHENKVNFLQQLI